jgi:hypothetical protein
LAGSRRCSSSPDRARCVMMKPTRCRGIDQVAMAAPITKWAHRVMAPSISHGW